MEDYEYCHHTHTNDFINISDLMSCRRENITTAVEDLAAFWQFQFKIFMSRRWNLKKPYRRHWPLNEEAARLFTSSKRILQNYARVRTLTAADLKPLIEDVLINPEFNADEVDTDMMERLNRAIADGA